MKNINFAFFLTLFFFLTSSQSFASTANPTIGGWKVNQTTDFGIGKKITATKTAIINGAEVVKTSTAVVIPKANNIAKFLAKNAAMAVAIGALDYVLDGVDYVMTDGAIVTKPPELSSITDKNSFPAYVPTLYCDSTNFSSATVCTADKSSYLQKYWENLSTVKNGNWINPTFCSSCNPMIINYTHIVSTNPYTTASRTMNVGVGTHPNPAYNPSVPVPVSTVIPVSQVASQVANRAVEDERRGVISPAVVAARTAAGEMIGEADDDTIAPPIVGSPSTPAEIAKELDKAAAIPSNPAAEGTITTPAVVDPVTGEVKTPAQTSNIALDFPEACSWFPQACIFIDWMMQEPDEDEAPELPTKELDAKDIDKNLVSISSSCPAPYQVSIPLPMFNTSYTDSVDISPYCSELEKLAPVLQLLAFVMAVMILKDI